MTLNIAADTPVALAMSPEIRGHIEALVREAAALFGATHYAHYDFLWSLTDQIMPDGLEHHESSDDRSPLRALLDEHDPPAPKQTCCRTSTHIRGMASTGARRDW